MVDTSGKVTDSDGGVVRANDCGVDGAALRVVEGECGWQVVWALAKHM